MEQPDKFIVTKADADAFASLLGRVQPGPGTPAIDTKGPGWGPATIMQGKRFFDAAARGDVESFAPGQVLNAVSRNTNFAEALAVKAETQIGTEEDAKHTNRGSAILKFQQATYLSGQGWPWCAAFVDWVWKEVALSVQPPAIRPRVALQRPQTASAFGLIDWAREQGLHVFLPNTGKPMRGDIVVYAFSHTGYVTGYTGGTSFTAVEGNTGSDGEREGQGVYRKTRAFSSVKAFIRAVSA